MTLILSGFNFACAGVSSEFRFTARLRHFAAASGRFALKLDSIGHTRMLAASLALSEIDHVADSFATLLRCDRECPARAHQSSYESKSFSNGL